MPQRGNGEGHSFHCFGWEELPRGQESDENEWMGIFGGNWGKSKGKVENKPMRKRKNGMWNEFDNKKIDVQ